MNKVISFNGAMNFHSWKLDLQSTQMANNMQGASMEP